MNDKRFIITYLILAIPLTIIFFQKNYGKPKDKPKSKILNKIFKKTYDISSKIPVLGNVLIYNRKKIMFYKNMPEEYLYLEIGKYMFVMALSVATGFVMSLIYFRDMFIAVISTIIIATYVNKKFYLKEYIFLGKLIESLEDLIHEYMANNMVLHLAYKNTIEYTNHTIRPHFQKIYKIILSGSAHELDEFCNETYSRFLKIIASYSLLTSQQGDKKIKNESMFQKNMYYIGEEIKDEYLKQKEILSRSSFEAFFIVAPLYALPFFEKFIFNYIAMFEKEGMEAFFFSNIGYGIKVFCVLVCFGCYMVYLNLVNFKAASEKIKVKIFDMKKIIIKIEPLRRAINFFTPSENTARYKKIRKLLIESGNINTVRDFYMKRITIGLSSFFLIYLIFLNGTYTNQLHILNSNDFGLKGSFVYQNIEQMKGGNSYDKELYAKNDKIIIEKLIKSKEFNKKTEEEKAEEIEKVLKDSQITGNYEMELIKERIIAKLAIMKDQNIKYYHFFIALMGASFFFMFPKWNLKLKIFFHGKSILYDETISFYTVIILLKNYSSTNVKTILLWLQRFSNIFYIPLQNAVNELNKTEKETALRNLKDEIGYKPLERIVDTLIHSDKTSIEEAFSGIMASKNFNSEDRKRTEKTIVSRRISIIKNLSRLSGGVVILFYFVFPILVNVFARFDLITSQIEKIN